MADLHAQIPLIDSRSPVSLSRRLSAAQQVTYRHLPSACNCSCKLKLKPSNCDFTFIPFQFGALVACKNIPAGKLHHLQTKQTAENMSPLRCRWVFLLLILRLGCAPTFGWMAHFRPSELKLHMELEDRVQLTLENVAPSTLQQPERFKFRVESAHTDLASIPAENATIPLSAFSPETRDWTGTIVVNAHFLGQTKIQVRLYDNQGNTSELPTNWSNDSTLDVKILRPRRVVDLVFVHTVIVLMTLLYINFGAALDLEVLRGLITRPLGPCIGFVMQVVGMPLLSYALGIFVFPNAPAMQLGLFFTGISPSGGASNTWSAVLGGNIHLSVLMTTISNVAAFATMPMWLFTLGQLVFERVGTEVPYQKIATYCGGLIFPLLVGLLVQRRLPRVARVLVRLLKQRWPTFTHRSR